MQKLNPGLRVRIRNAPDAHARDIPVIIRALTDENVAAKLAALDIDATEIDGTYRATVSATQLRDLALEDWVYSVRGANSSRP